MISAQRHLSSATEHTRHHAHRSQCMVQSSLDDPEDGTKKKAGTPSWPFLLWLRGFRTSTYILTLIALGLAATALHTVGLVSFEMHPRRSAADADAASPAFSVGGDDWAGWPRDVPSSQFDTTRCNIPVRCVPNV